MNACEKPWSAHTMVNASGKDMSPDEMAEYVREAMVASSLESGETSFWFISAQGDDGKGQDICHIGNGSGSEEVAHRIVRLHQEDLERDAREAATTQRFVSVKVEKEIENCRRALKCSEEIREALGEVLSAMADARDVAKAEARKLKESRDNAYNERNRLVAALSRLFPASLERHPDGEEWEEDWRWIVFIDLPTGQVSWHIHDSELSLFDHLERFEGRSWDGHSTPAKYERLAALRHSDDSYHAARAKELQDSLKRKDE